MSTNRWQLLAMEHGQAADRPRGGDQHLGRIKAHENVITGLIVEQDGMGIAYKSDSIIQTKLMTRHHLPS